MAIVVVVFLSEIITLIFPISPRSIAFCFFFFFLSESLVLFCLRQWLSCSLHTSSHSIPVCHTLACYATNHTTLRLPCSPFVFALSSSFFCMLVTRILLISSMKVNTVFFTLNHNSHSIPLPYPPKIKPFLLLSLLGLKSNLKDNKGQISPHKSRM
jgi:hypothetical protein